MENDLIERGFRDLAELLAIDGVNPATIAQFRRVFFCGAVQCFDVMLKIEEVPEDQGQDILHAVDAELRAFMKDDLLILKAH